MPFLQASRCGTPRVSNTKEVISGLPTGKLRVMHLALANSRQERAAALAMHTPLDPARPCVSRVQKEGIAFQEDLNATGL